MNNINRRPFLDPVMTHNNQFNLLGQAANPDACPVAALKVDRQEINFVVILDHPHAKFALVVKGQDRWQNMMGAFGANRDFHFGRHAIRNAQV